MPRIFVQQIEIGADAIDIHRHINNQEYLRWMQEIAIAHSAAQGWSMQRYIDCGISWYVKSHFIEYLRPGFLGDHLTICTWVATLFLREADHHILARAETQWIFVSLNNGRPLPIPEEVHVSFEIVGTEEAVLREIGWTAPTGKNPA
ncbi:MAG: Acyl-ACP thioesterase [Betaproteobacteria bacterium ADurb.Bin341]|nr:MAG: Acyl-ACP thioesterase [Betaproteobacteria bacterium ADurb.Bin341]